MNAPNARPLPSSVVRDDEPILVAAAKHGEIAAFEELVTRYERKIFRLTRNITGNQEDAEDEYDAHGDEHEQLSQDQRQSGDPLGRHRRPRRCFA